MHNSADEVLYSMTETHKCKPLKVEMLSDVEYARKCKFFENQQKSQ